MLFPMTVMSSSPALTGGEGSFRTFGTTGINTTHSAVRGT